MNERAQILPPLLHNALLHAQARCTTKGERKRFNNARGDGQLFSFDLLDEEGSDIRVTGFGDVVSRQRGRTWLRKWMRK